MNLAPADFAASLLDWFDRHGRHDLPWQHPRTPFRVWVAEVMLQQTQVGTVIPYFQRFVQRWDGVAELASAHIDDVLALWSGLGYYSRARNLHRCAQLCVERHGGDLPRDFDSLSALPGIGRSTAAAILAQAHGQRHAILDGNVRRVLARVYAIREWTGSSAVQQRLWLLADAHTPQTRVCDYTQAIMDLGATLCTRSRPDCGRCPLASDCKAHREGLTAVLPVPRPRKATPERSVLWMLIRNNEDAVLLERRPPSGIWGGLWSLPERPVDGPAQARPELARVQHSFTHFRLQARVVCATLPCILDAQDRETAWFRREQLATLGLPAPVRTLLMDQLSRPSQ